MTDRQINKYYQKRNYKPVFQKYMFENKPIHFAKVGSDSNQTILFIHGAPGAWYGYLNILDDSLLRSKFSMISVDRLGYGKSDFGKSEIQIQKQAQALQQIIDSVPNKKPIIVVGRSFGAPIAAQLAVNNQQKVKTLFLLGPDLNPETEKFWWFSKMAASKLSLWLLPKSLEVATDEKFSRIAELKKLLPIWENITIPVIVMHGEKDWIVDTSNVGFAKKMLKNSPDSKFIKIPKAGHIISIERPDLLKTEILKYFVP
jgi:pimeloyl-ACP methyl ester carboxylesterase